MRERILTEREREAIKKYLKDKKGSNLINVTKYRTRKFLKGFKEDVALLEALIE